MNRIARAGILLWPSLGLGIFLAASMVVGFWLWSHERDRLIAENGRQQSLLLQTRLVALDRFLAQQWAPLERLAQNESLALFLDSKKNNVSSAQDDRALADYARQILTASAVAYGYSSLTPRDGSSQAGLTVFDEKGAVLLRSQAGPEEPWHIPDKIGAALWLESREGLMLALAVPMASGGWVLGKKPIGTELASLLKSTEENSTQFSLVRHAGDAIAYILPPRPGLKPLQFSFPAAATAIDTVASFATPGVPLKAENAFGAQVLAIGLPVADTDWMLVSATPLARILEPLLVETRLLVLLWVGASLAVACLMWALWHRGASRRALVFAQEAHEARLRYEQERLLLHMVTDCFPGLVSIVDNHQRYVFANQAMTAKAGIGGDLIGKRLAAVLGPDLASAMISYNKRATKGQVVYEREDESSKYLVQHVALPDGQALILEQNITEFARVRDHQMELMHALVDTVIDAIDERDPFAQHHSRRVDQLGQAIAKEMGLEPPEQQAIGLAGRLLNFGKLLVPPDLLVKRGAMTAEEQRIMRDAHLRGIALLERAAFQDMALDIMRETTAAGQKPARAQIVLLANAFVAMISARAYRSALAPDAALDQLMAEHRFDRAVLAALLHCVENKRGLVLASPDTPA
jgi:HD-GYP domain-containing protein (c-di-GMP phosphodiesterase class II)